MKYLGHSARTSPPSLLAVMTAAALVLTACGGSAVSAEEAARANNGLTQVAAGAAQPGAVAGSGGAAVPGTIDGGVPTTSRTGSVTGGTATSGEGTSAPAAVRGAAPATGSGVRAGSCAGFKNTDHITDTTIPIASSADISGPVPGIFKPAGDATKAYAAYFNSTSTICGRKLDVKVFDTQTNTSGDAVAAQRACDETFAAVGSIASFDQGGLANTNKCGIPELRSLFTTKQRASCPRCFAAQSPSGGQYARAIPDYFTKLDKAVTQKAAMLYVAVNASADAAQGVVKAHERVGWKYALTSSFDIAEFNYGPYVQRMKSAGVRIVQMYGSTDMAVRMAKAMQAANFKPAYFSLVGTQYDRAFAQGGPAVEAANPIISIDFAPIEEAGRNPELALYMQWLQQVVPGAQPTYFGLYAWSAARLFAEQATALGGKLTRATLVERLRRVTNWTANGLHAPQPVGPKSASKCWRFLQVKGGSFVPFGPVKYTCGGTISTR